MTQSERDELIFLGVTPNSPLWEQFEGGVLRLEDGRLVPVKPPQAGARVRWTVDAELMGEICECLAIAVQDCPCSLRERESGHRIDCYAPVGIEALAKARGENAPLPAQPEKEGAE